VEDAFHSSGTEDFIEGKEGDEEEGEETAGWFLPEDITSKNELGVPRDDRLIEVEEDVFL